jgi:hypothetical protein
MGSDKIELLRAELSKQQEQKQNISTKLLDPGWKKEEVKALLDRGAELDLKIEAIENEIRELEHPGQPPGESINPWMSE